MSFDQRAARKTARYQKMRRGFLACNPLCASCLKSARVQAAQELDHIKPAARAPALFWNTENWQGLCRLCHEAKTAAENAGGTPDQIAWRERNMKLYGV